jgi:hypothetical protein
MDAAPTESHGKLAPVSPTDAFQFHLVFSNKTETDGYCLGIWTELTARGVQVWQQKKNIPKDSDNWFSEWYPSANVSIKIVCFLTAAYLKSIYCMKEFRVAAAMDKLLVVVCEPMQAIRAVDPGQYPHAPDAMAYLLGGGQVIFHDSDDVVSEIRAWSSAFGETLTRSRASSLGSSLNPHRAELGAGQKLKRPLPREAYAARSTRGYAA